MDSHSSSEEEEEDAADEAAALSAPAPAPQALQAPQRPTNKQPPARVERAELAVAVVAAPMYVTHITSV